MARRVLIVDDDADSMQALVILLSMWGFDVAEARTCAEAVAKAAWLRPDIAIVDLGLPDMDGCEVARALSRMPERPFLIALTGHAEPAFRQAAHDAGFDVFAVKPWDIDQMHSVLTALDTARRRTSSV